MVLKVVECCSVQQNAAECYSMKGHLAGSWSLLRAILSCRAGAANHITVFDYTSVLACVVTHVQFPLGLRGAARSRVRRHERSRSSWRAWTTNLTTRRSSPCASSRVRLGVRGKTTTTNKKSEPGQQRQYCLFNPPWDTAGDHGGGGPFAHPPAISGRSPLACLGL